MKLPLFIFSAFVWATTALGAAASPGSSSSAAAFEFYAFDTAFGFREPAWEPVELRADTLKELGYTGISQTYPGVAHLEKVVQAFDARGLKIHSLYFTVALGKTDPLPPNLKEGLKRLKGHGTILWAAIQQPRGADNKFLPFTKGEHDDECVKALQSLCAMAVENGLKVALYDHRANYLETTEECLLMVEKVGCENLGVTFNVCHEFMSNNGGRFEEILQKSLPKLWSVSVNGADPAKNQFILRLDQGSFDLAAFLKMLRKVGYTGPVGLQGFRVPGDIRENLAIDMKVWKEAITALSTDAGANAAKKVESPAPKAEPNANAATTNANPLDASALETISRFKFGTSVDIMLALEKKISAAKPTDYPALEAQLLPILQAPGTPPEGQRFICDMLAIVGTETCVPVLGKLLGNAADEKTAQMICQALQPLPYANVNKPLIQALSSLKGPARREVVNTLADRKAAEALPALKELLKEGLDPQNVEDVRAVLAALGAIGGSDAAKILNDFGARIGFSSTAVPAPVQAAWQHASLHCAAGLASSGKAEDLAMAKKMEAVLDTPNALDATRFALFAIKAAEGKEKAVPALIQALASKDLLQQDAAVTAIVNLPDRAVTQALAAELERVVAQKSELRLPLMRALASRGDGSHGLREAFTRMASANDSNEPALREAALRGLGRLGNADSVPVLVAALKEKGAMATAASDTLTCLSGSDIQKALMKQTEEASDPAQKAILLGLLSKRGDIAALPFLKKLLTAPTPNEPKVTTAAYSALARLGGPEEVRFLVETLLNSKESAQKQAIVRTISLIAPRIQKKNRSADLIAALPKADSETKALLLSLFPALFDQDGLVALKAALNSPADSVEHLAAVRALSEWPLAEALPEMVRLAGSRDEPENCRLLALIGFIRLIEQRQVADKMPHYKKAMELATRPEEKRLILSGLSQFPAPEGLSLCEPLLNDPALSTEAYLAYEKIAEALPFSDATQLAPSLTALERVLAAAPTPEIKAAAQRALDRLKAVKK